MPRRRVTIASTVGLHARPAALFVQAAAEQSAPVAITKVTGDVAGDPVDARSLLAVLALDARHGDEVELTAEYDSAGAALDHLRSLLAQDLDAGQSP